MIKVLDLASVPDSVKTFSNHAPNTVGSRSAFVRLRFDSCSTGLRLGPEQQLKLTRRCPEPVSEQSRTTAEQQPKNSRRRPEAQSKVRTGKRCFAPMYGQKMFCPY